MRLLQRIGFLAAIVTAGAAAAQTPPAAFNSTAPFAMPEPVPAKEALAPLQDTRLWYWDTGGDGVPIVLVEAL